MRAGPPQESGGPPPANPPRRSMSKEDNIEVTGTVLEKFPSGKFSVQIDHDRVVLAHLAGRLRRNRIRVLAGDKVTLELSPYDLTKGRITFRHRYIPPHPRHLRVPVRYITYVAARGMLIIYKEFGVLRSTIIRSRSLASAKCPLGLLSRIDVTGCN